MEFVTQIKTETLNYLMTLYFRNTGAITERHSLDITEVEVDEFDDGIIHIAGLLEEEKLSG